MITFSATTVLVLGLIALLVLALGVWAYSTANRLDRLHVRSDQSWQALDAALARRAVVARAVAMSEAGPVSTDPRRAERASRLAALADRAERADRGMGTIENQLSAALSLVDIDHLRPQLVAELADAEARVLIARRFHNDAVRDTLALRTRRPVRILHLGGTAPLPHYFEITERATPAAATGLIVDNPHHRAGGPARRAEPRAAAARPRPDDPRGGLLVHRRRRARTGGEPARCRGPRGLRGNRAAGGSRRAAWSAVAPGGGVPVQR